MNCLYCKKEILQKRNTKKYCSPKCRVYHNRTYILNGQDKPHRVDLSRLNKKDEPVPVLRNTALCKHGYAAIYCKFAKNGKPCNKK